MPAVRAWPLPSWTRLRDASGAAPSTVCPVPRAGHPAAAMKPFTSSPQCHTDGDTPVLSPLPLHHGHSVSLLPTGTVLGPLHFPSGRQIPRAAPSHTPPPSRERSFQNGERAGLLSLPTLTSMVPRPPLSTKSEASVSGHPLGSDALGSVLSVER